MTAKPRGRAPRSAAERELRDTLILDLFLAGNTQRAIAANPQVKLTAARVNQVIKVELDRATKDHILRNENAMLIYQARMEMLVRNALEHVSAGDLKAIEVARRLMADQAKLDGLTDGELRNPVPPMSDSELDGVEPADDLARYRARRNDATRKRQA